jgi:hypothetical protein
MASQKRCEDNERAGLGARRTSAVRANHSPSWRLERGATARLIAASSIRSPTEAPRARVGQAASIASAMPSARATLSAAATAPKERTWTARGSPAPSVSRRATSSGRPR